MFKFKATSLLAISPLLIGTACTADYEFLTYGDGFTEEEKAAAMANRRRPVLNGQEMAAAALPQQAQRAFPAAPPIAAPAPTAGVNPPLPTLGGPGFSIPDPFGPSFGAPVPPAAAPAPAPAAPQFPEGQLPPLPPQPQIAQPIPLPGVAPIPNPQPTILPPRVEVPNPFGAQLPPQPTGLGENITLKQPLPPVPSPSVVAAAVIEQPQMPQQIPQGIVPRPQIGLEQMPAGSKIDLGTLTSANAPTVEVKEAPFMPPVATPRPELLPPGFEQPQAPAPQPVLPQFAAQPIRIAQPIQPAPIQFEQPSLLPEPMPIMPPPRPGLAPPMRPPVPVANTIATDPAKLAKPRRKSTRDYSARSASRSKYKRHY